MLWLHASSIAETILAFRVRASAGVNWPSDAKLPGGRLSCADTPGVSHTPNGVLSAVSEFCILSCCAFTAGDKYPTNMVARAATEIAWTMNRVLFRREEPRGS